MFQWSLEENEMVKEFLNMIAFTSINLTKYLKAVIYRVN